MCEPRFAAIQNSLSLSLKITTSTKKFVMVSSLCPAIISTAKPQPSLTLTLTLTTHHSSLTTHHPSDTAERRMFQMPNNFFSNASSPDTFWSEEADNETSTPLTEGSFVLGHVQEIKDTEESSTLLNSYILVVGGCGFIGSHTVWELAKAGYNVFSPLLKKSDGANLGV